MDNSNNQNRTDDVEKGSNFDLSRSNPHIIISKPEKESAGTNCMVGMVFCSVVVLLFGLVGASVAYYVFSIMALVEDSNDSLQKECKNSNMWGYLLTVIIVNLVVLNNSKPKDDEGSIIMSSIISILIMISLCTWGSIEFWNDCVQDNLSNTLIFKMIQITIYMQYSVLCILVMVIVYTCRKISGNVNKTIQKS